MDIRILKDKNNALLNRRELDFVVKYEGSTPSTCYYDLFHFKTFLSKNLY